MMQIASLEEKDWQIRVAQKELQLLKIEIDNEENTRQELEETIAEERRIADRIPAYQIDKQIRQWQETLARTEGQLRLLREKQAIQEESCEKQRELGLKQSRILEELRKRAERLHVPAPFAGRLRRVHPSPESIAPGETILELWDESELVVNAHIWQNQLRSVALGAKAAIFPDFYRGTDLSGTVRALLAVDTSASEGRFPKFPVVIGLDAQNEHLVVGMTVSVRIHMSHSAEGGD